MFHLRKWEPFKDFIERFFEEDLFSSLGRFTTDFATDVYETDKDVVVEMHVPGFKKENIKISFKDGYLRVEGKAEEEREEKNKNYWRREIRRGSFARVIPLPVDVDSNKAKATFQDGVLKIVLPKVETEEREGEEIKIE